MGSNEEQVPTPYDSPESVSLEEALLVHAGYIERAVIHGAGSLIRHEAREDLVQGIRVRVLERADAFSWQGEAAFGAWIKRVSSNYMDDRRAYWNAARRNAGHQLRIQGPSTSTASAFAELQSERTGPATHADRREQLELAMQSLSMLLERDQVILAHDRAGASLGELATELGLGLEGATKARQRARSRFARAFELLQRSGGAIPPPGAAPPKE